MKPIIPFGFFIYLTVLINSRCTYGLSSAFVKVHKLNNVDVITEFPLNYQEIETTTEGFGYNVTLDTRLVNDTDRNWKYSSLRLKKWFEYYNDTAHLVDLTSNETTCANVISDNANKLEERNGIWVACHDSTLDIFCQTSRSCYPEINYNFGQALSPLRTVKIYLSLRGLAIVRLNIGSGTTCFDYSRRKDPFSPCKYIQVESTGQWEMVRSGFDGYDNQQFSSFTISLIARFKSDVALIDKIEMTDFLLCSYAEGNCTTIAPGPTRNTPSTTTFFPPTTEETSVVTDSSTTKPTTKCPVPVTTKKLSIIQVFNTSTFDTRDDLIPIENGWDISGEFPRWLEYYIDSNSLKDHSDNMSTCANILPSSFVNLTDVVGIWATCTDNSQLLNCSVESCYPLIYNGAPEGYFIFSVKATFFLHNLAILRLYIGDECVDYSFEDTFSTCKFIKILPDGIYWRKFYWTSAESSHNEKQLASFSRLELVSRSDTDVLLIDKVEVEYRQCNNGNCTSEPTTTTTEFYDCDEYEDTTITYTTTTESDPTEDAVTTSSTSDNSENPTTESKTTPKGTYSRSPHSLVPTIFTLLVGAVITFVNWKY